MKIIILIFKPVILFVLFINTCTFARSPSLPSLPLIGAQVFIEPGQRPENIEKWYRILNEAGNSISNIPVRFKEHENGVMMRTVRSGNLFVSLVINNNQEKKDIEIELSKSLKPSIIFSDKSGTISNKNICSLNPEETMAIKWE